jgi:hypothetical protein
MKKSKKKSGTQSETEVVRQYFRMPISKCSNISLRISDQAHEIVNIGNRGIAFYADETTETVKDQSILHPVTLQLRDKSIHLQGQTMHISPSGYQDICGMKFIDMEKKSQKILEKYLHDTLASVFEE